MAGVHEDTLRWSGNRPCGDGDHFSMRVVASLDWGAAMPDPADMTHA
jgi:hypothetical protein